MACLITSVLVPALSAAPVPLFDARTLAGWEGDTNTTWRVRDGVIVGGSLSGNPRNEFLASTRAYTNFILRLEYRLVGTEGFVNGGVQFRSVRIASPPHEMAGYQADIGAGYSGSLYDESRRNRFLAQADTNWVARLEKPGEWNRYEVEAVGAQVVLRLNGARTAVWVETNATMAASGLVALQIHGGCKAEISFRDITIEELGRPAIPAESEVLGRFGDAQPMLPPGPFEEGRFALGQGETIAFVGQENTVRHQKSGDLEALLAVAFADQKPRFRWMGWEADTVYEQWRDLNFGAWTVQLERAGATVVVAQFGQVEALDGVGRLPEFVAAYHRLLDSLAQRTRRLVLVSPMPFERPLASHAPDLTRRNRDVAEYADAIRGVARQRGAVFVDLMRALGARGPGASRLTDDGMHLNDEGLRVVAAAVAAELGVKGGGHGDLAASGRGGAEEPALVRHMAPRELVLRLWRPGLAEVRQGRGQRALAEGGVRAAQADDRVGRGTDPCAGARTRGARRGAGGSIATGRDGGLGGAVAGGPTGDVLPGRGP